MFFEDGTRFTVKGVRNPRTFIKLLSDNRKAKRLEFSPAMDDGSEDLGENDIAIVDQSFGSEDDGDNDVEIGDKGPGSEDDGDNDVEIGDEGSGSENDGDNDVDHGSVSVDVDDNAASGSVVVEDNFVEIG